MTKNIQITLKMQYKIFLPCRCHFFPKSIGILKRPKCEIAPPGTQAEVRYMRLRSENGPYCDWSIRYAI